MGNQQRSYQDNKFYPIPEEPQFGVTTNGKVKNFKTERILKPFTDGDGYKRVSLCRDGEIKKYYVHRLVALTFISEGYAEGLQVNHKDSVRDNNHYSNLEWVTPKENTLHGIEFGHIVVKGENCPRASISEEQVVHICHSINSGESIASISQRMSIPVNTVFSIKSGQTWKDISCNILTKYVKPNMSIDLVKRVCGMLQDCKTTEEILESIPEINRHHIGNIRNRKTFKHISIKYSW